MRVRRFALVLFVLVTARAFSWAPATHVYLAERATGSNHPDVYFGSILPDMSHVVINKPEIAKVMRRLGHYESGRVEPSCLALGMLTHNEEWGTDWYAHQYFLSDTPESADLYSTVKIRHLEAELGVQPGEAEFLFEFAIDYLLRVDDGPALGRKMLAGATLFGPTREQMIVDAFAAPLAKRVHGLSLEEAETELRTAARRFRSVTKAYATAYMQDEALAFEALTAFTALYLQFDCDTAAAYLSYAIELCRDDYQAELERIAELLRADLATHAPEPVAACSWGCSGPVGTTAAAGFDPLLAVWAFVGIAWTRAVRARNVPSR